MEDPMGEMARVVWRTGGEEGLLALDGEDDWAALESAVELVKDLLGVR